MRHYIYSIHDDVAETFTTVICDFNDDTARRNFRYSIEETKDIRNFAPQDFALYRVGSFDDDSGVIIPERPTLIERGVKRAVQDTVREDCNSY